MNHLDQFTQHQRDALDIVTRLHDAMRNMTGTGGRFRAGSAEEMLNYCATVTHAMQTVRGNDALLQEFGRQRTTALSVTGPQCIPGGVPEADLRAFYHDPQNLLAAGALALGEITTNVQAWLVRCGAAQPATDTGTLN
jgi:hypothetical protein